MSTRIPTVLAPEPILCAALRVVFVAAYTTRNWTLGEAVSRKQINDLWEAIHNVPDLVCRWRAGAERELLGYFDEYDGKWPQPRLRLPTSRSFGKPRHNLPIRRTAGHGNGPCGRPTLPTASGKNWISRMRVPSRSARGYFDDCAEIVKRCERLWQH